MYKKVYASRSVSRMASLDHPIGDPTGGAAFGEFNDPMSIVGVGAGLIGSSMASDAAGDAANAQLQGSREANQTQRYMYDTTRADNAPFLANGTAANNKLAYMLGLNPYGATGGYSSGGGTLTRDQIRSQLLPQFTKQIPASGAMYGGSQADQILGQLFDVRYPGQNIYPQQNQQTVDEVALNAAIEAQLAKQAQSQQSMQQAASQDPAYGSLLRRFSMSDLNSDPVYQNGLQFGLDEGRKAINRQAAAGGGLLSGATLKALTKYGNDYGSTKANESYNRYNNDQNMIYNRLAGISGTGQTAVGQVGAAGQNYANNVSQNQIGAGNARASGYVGSANAINSGISQGLSIYQNNQLLNKLAGGGSFGGGDWWNSPQGINANGGGF